jgi:hypothetical protein
LSIACGSYAAELPPALPQQENKGVASGSKVKCFADHRLQFCAKVHGLGNRGQMWFDPLPQPLTRVVQQLCLMEHRRCTSRDLPADLYVVLDELGGLPGSPLQQPKDAIF